MAKTSLKGSLFSKIAVVREVSMFPADCRKRTGMSLIPTFNKFSGLTCASWKAGKRKPVYRKGIISLMHRWSCCTVRLDFHFIPVLCSSSWSLTAPIVWSSLTGSSQSFLVLLRSTSHPFTGTSIFFKLLQLLDHYSVIIFVFKNNKLPVLICSANPDLPLFCWFAQFS